MDLKDLDYREFELLVGLLLSRLGFRIVRGPANPSHPSGSPLTVDFETVSPDNIPTFVEVKHYR